MKPLLNICHLMQKRLITCLLVIGTVLLLTPNAATAQSQSCNSAITARMSLAIGFYRLEIAASHLVEQIQTAASKQRRVQLLNAKNELQKLNKNLNTRLMQMTSTPDANGLCSETPEKLTQIHTALSTYSEVVQGRWTFTQKRLGQLQTLPQGANMPWDPMEASLWIDEPRARYDVWRTIAQATPQQTETASALFVMGMLTRIEWQSAMALNSSLTQGQNSDAPRQHLLNAVKDTDLLLSNWPATSVQSNTEMWKNLRAIANASPARNASDIPQAAPQQGWTAWIGGWLQNYSQVFMQSISKVLTGLEDMNG